MPMPHYLEKTNMSTPAVTARYVLISCDDLLNFNQAIIEFFLGKCLHWVRKTFFTCYDIQSIIGNNFNIIVLNILKKLMQNNYFLNTIYIVKSNAH